MKFILWLLFLLPVLPAFSQGSQVIDPKDSCLATLDVVHFTQVDTGHVLVQKDAVAHLLRYLRNCAPRYKYPSTYTDRGFTLIVPGYLQSLSYGFGDAMYSISLLDTAELHQTITIHVDMDGHYQLEFLAAIQRGTKEATQQRIGNRDYWFFKNWEDRYAGLIFLDSTTSISYYTPTHAAEKALQEAIASFAWKP